MSARASEIAAFLGAKLSGPDINIDGVSASNSPQPNTLTFIKKGCGVIPSQGKFADCLVIADLIPWVKRTVSMIPASNPRLAWARVVKAFFPSVTEVWYDDSGQDWPYEFTEIRRFVTIASNTDIGYHCLIKSGARIGEEGFGFEIDEDGHPFRIPHLGRVVIGNHVEIGCNTVIARGTIGDTVIHDYVKIDDQVFVAHNVEIGENTLVIAKAEISGSVKIGRNCWIGASACIREHVTVGDGALVGMGAVVVKDVEPGSVVAGNPAQKIKMRGDGE